MGVYIPSMEMPINCLQCSFVRIVSDHHYCGCNANCMLGEYVGEYLEGVGRHEGCPLVQLPEKHGRLGDLDEIKNKLAKDKREAFTKHDVWLMISCYGAETIVEAEGE